MLAAADVMQNALQPAAREAGHIANLWWLFFWVLTTVFVAVAVALFALNFYAGYFGQAMKGL